MVSRSTSPQRQSHLTLTKEGIVNEKKRSLSEEAYRIFKKRILTMEGGSHLSARKFAAEVGMSYTPVREAFIRMQKEGTLRLVPNVGFFVQTMGVNDLLQIFQVRECMECFILDKVFDRFTKTQIDEMEEMNRQEEASLMRGDIFEYQQIDRKFHEIPFLNYGNRHLLNFYRDLRDQYMICSNEVANTHSHEAIEEHATYLASLRSGNKLEAIDCLKTHIIRARERMINGFIQVINEE